MPSVFLPVFINHNDFITTGDEIMNNVHSWLRNLKSHWLKEPKDMPHLGPFYLTPAERYALLKELLMPLSESQKPGK